MKKILSWVLTIAMVLSFVPAMAISTFAAGEEMSLVLTEPALLKGTDYKGTEYSYYSVDVKIKNNSEGTMTVKGFEFYIEYEKIGIAPASILYYTDEEEENEVRIRAVSSIIEGWSSDYNASEGMIKVAGGTENGELVKSINAGKQTKLCTLSFVAATDAEQGNYTLSFADTFIDIDTKENKIILNDGTTLTAAEGTLNQDATVALSISGSLPTLNTVSLTKNAVTVAGGNAAAQTIGASATSAKGTDITAGVTWSVSPTGKGVTIAADGTVSVTATAEAGAYTVSAASKADASQGETKTATLTVSRETPVLTSVAVAANSVAVPTAAEATKTATMTATVLDQYGSAMSGESITWSIPTTTGVTIDSATGVVTVIPSASAGTVVVTATAGVKNGTANLVVTKATPAATGITISGADAVTIPTGNTPAEVTYTATVTDQFGAEMSGQDISWQVNGNEITGVDIAEGGILSVSKAASAGQVTVIASVSGTSVKATKTVTLQSIVFNENPNPTLKSSPVYGDKWSEIVTALGTFSATVGGTPVPGTYSLKDESLVPAAGEQNYTILFNSTDGNYKDVIAYTGTVTIAPKTLTSSDLEYKSGAITKTYDGTVTATGIVIGAKDGVLVGTDTLTISGTAAYNSKDVATATKITFTPAAITTGNYALTASQTVEITGASITAKAITANDMEKDGGSLTKTYDGTTASDVTVKVKSGVLFGEDTLTVTGSSVYNSKDVASATKITFTPTAITTGNYTLAASQTVEFTGASITAKVLTAANLEQNSGNLSKTYDGTTASDVTVKVKSGVLFGEDTLAVTGTAVYNSADVSAANKITFTPNAITTGNYVLAASQKVTFTSGVAIAKADVASVTGLETQRRYTTKFSELETSANAKDANNKTENAVVTWYSDNTYAAQAAAGNAIADAGKIGSTVTLYFKLSGMSNHNDYSGSLTVDITDKTLLQNISFTAPANNPVFDGSVIAAGTDFTAPTAPNATKADGWTYSYQPEGGSYATGLPTNAGTYTIKASYADDEYQGEATISLTIDKAEVGKPAVSGTYTYTGEIQTVTLTGFDSTKMAYVSDSNKATDAGKHNVVVALNDADNTKWQGGSSSNLTLTWNIAKAVITNSGAFQNFSGTYDGNEHGIALDSTKLSTVKNQTATVTYSTDGETYSATAPTEINATASAVTVYWKVTAPNHEDLTGSNTITISKATLTVDTAPTATAVYLTKQKSIPAPTGGTVKLGETEVAGTWAWTNNTVETLLEVGTTAKINATFTPTAGAANYNALTVDITPTITKAEAPTGLTKTYSIYFADTAAKTITASNFGMPADAGTLTLKEIVTGPTGTYLDTAKTTATAFQLKSGLTKEGAAGKSESFTVKITSQNYADATVTVTVNIVDISIPWPDAADLALKQDAKYGDTNADILKGFTTGTVTAMTAESITGKYSVKNATLIPDAGTTAVVLVFTADAGQSVSGSFEQEYTVPAVAKRTVTLTSGSGSKTYDGTALTNDKVEVSGDGFLTGEGATYTVTGVQTNAGNSKNYFTYELQTGTKESNYVITKVEGDLAVSKIATPITVTANSGSKTYDGTAITDSGFTYTQNVLAAGDTLTATVEGTQTNAGTSENIVTEYKIMRGTDDVTANYTIEEPVAGTLTVAKAPLTITAKDHTITYGAEPANGGVNYDGFVNEETESVLSTAVKYDYDYQQFQNVGKYVITPKEATAENYEITFQSGKLTVEPKEIGLSWTVEDNIYYNGEVQNVTAVPTGMENSDELTVTVVGGTETEIGDYIAKATALVGTKAENYKLPTDNKECKTYSIIPALTSVTATPDTVTATIDGLTINLSGYVNSGEVPGVSGYTIDEEGKLTANGVTYTVNTENVIEKDAKVDVKTETTTVEKTDDADETITDTIINEIAQPDTKGEGLTSAAPAVIQKAAKDTPEEVTTVEVTMNLQIAPISFNSFMLELEITPIVTIVHKDSAGAQVGNPETDVIPNTQIVAPVTISVKLPAGMPTTNLYAKHFLNEAKTLFEIIHVSVSGDVATWKQSSFSTTVLYADARSADVTFTFDDGHTQNKTLTAEDLNSVLPADSKSGYSFKGWNFFIDGSTTALEGSPFTTLTDELLDAVNAATIVAEPEFMQYVPITPVIISSTYPITIQETENGSISADYSKAQSGKEITVTVEPKEGYRIDKLTVTGQNGNVVEVLKQSNGKYTFVMPASAVVVEAVFAERVMVFEDVKAGDWFYDAVLWAVENQVTNGTDETHFSPYDLCTRGQVITFLWRAAGSPMVNYAMPFTDVEADTYYTEAVRWAVSLGITNGTSETTFSPSDNITREQLATLIYNYAKTLGDGFTGQWMFLLDFDDADEISSWANEAMHWCVMKEIVQGMGDNRLAPKNTATRGQIVTMIARYFAG